jgi:regulator of nucleoside diphosphate kinase
MSQTSSAPRALPSIVVSALDAERLNLLLDTLSPAKREAAAGLEAELARAEVVELQHMPADVVAMNSRVRLEDVATGVQSEAVLVYPHEADLVQRRLSILAPLGTALLGLRLGQEIDWPLPTGKHKRIRLLRIFGQTDFASDLGA